MFISATVEKNRNNSFDVGTRLIRAEALYGLQANGTGSKFTYPMNYRDRRSRNTYLECTDSVATVTTGMTTAYTDGTITLNVYPENNSTITPVSTIFEVTNIQWGVASGATDTYLYILEGAFKLNKVLVAHTIAQVIALA